MSGRVVDDVGTTATDGSIFEDDRIGGWDVEEGERRGMIELLEMG